MLDGAAVGIATLCVALTLALLLTAASLSYAGAGWPGATVELLAALSITVAAGVSVTLTPVRGQAVPLALMAVAWLTPVWIGWVGGPAPVRTIATAAAPWLVPALLHAAVWSRRRERAIATLVAAAYVGTGVIVVATALFSDPFRDPACWNNCTAGVLLIAHVPAAATAVRIALPILAATCLLVAATHTFTRAGLRRQGDALASVAASGALAAIATGAVLVAAGMDPGIPMLSGLHAATAGLLVIMAAGSAWAAMRARARSQAVGDIAATLREGASVRATLAAALDDDTLTVLYRHPDGTGYVDEAGDDCAPNPDGDRAATLIRRDGEIVARVEHDEGSTSLLADVLGPAMRLALDNERLRASVLAQLRALRLSREQVVEAEDAARRTLERNLHDGAQQTLVALLYELARARERARADVAASASLARIATDARAALDRVRRIARGIFPLGLEEEGIASAVESLADDARVPIVVTASPSRRYTPPVERAAYLTVLSASEAACGGSLEVQIRESDGLLRVAVGPTAPGELSVLRDRVLALGGSVTLNDRVLRAEVPCA